MSLRDKMFKSFLQENRLMIDIKHIAIRLPNYAKVKRITTNSSLLWICLTQKRPGKPLEKLLGFKKKYREAIALNINDEPISLHQLSKTVLSKTMLSK